MKKLLDTKIKDMKAITLIALVITIVVLIILAAVAINLSLGNNGIFNKAKEAKEKYTNAQDYEEIETAKLTNQVDALIGESFIGGSSRFDNDWQIDTLTASDFPFTVPDNGFLQVTAQGSDAFYISGASTGMICTEPWGNGSATSMGFVKNGDVLTISYNGANSASIYYIH